MKTTEATERNRWQRAVGLVVAMGLGALLLAILLLELRGAPIYADTGTLYVSTTGSDTSNCRYPAAPCQTIGYAISQALPGDTIRVAQGVYTENLTINISATLEGGYESVGWTRDSTQYETTIDGSNSQTVIGDWDAEHIGSAVVISNEGISEMWYDGRDMFGNVQLGRATSSDGATWTKDAGNPLFGSGASGTWDEGNVSEPFVLLDGATYELWYTANGKVIGYATSTDGITWTRHPSPVLEGGPEGAWDEDGVSDPYVIKAGGTYTMWYESWTDTGRIGCAMSTDAINWAKCAANPVLEPGNPGDWDEIAVHDPVVVLHDGTYHMWYRGTDPDWTWHIGHVTSTDGMTWTRFLTDPVLSGTGGEWDEGSVGLGDVSFDGAIYHMRYEANSQIGYALSADGVSWAKSPSNPVLTPGAPSQWGQPVVKFESESNGAVLDGFTVTGGDANQGSGIVVYGSTVTIQSCTVDDNRAWDAGAGIGIADGANVTIHNTLVTNNVRWGGGGGGAGLWADGSTVTVTNSIFQSNEATHHPGGGIGLWNDAIMNAINITVASNTNGGIDLRGASITLIDSRVLSNTAESGAGLAVDGSSTATIEGCQFMGNVASQSGGGLASFGHAEVTIVDSVFQGNSAQEWHGGAIEGMGQRLEMHRTQILNNQAPFGGGIDVAKEVYLEDVEITGNIATHTGGGVRVPAGGATMVISDTRILTNTAFEGGGGIQLWQGSIEVHDTLIRDNNAGKGAGIWANYWEGSPNLTLVNTLVVSNTSSDQAGGLWLEGWDATLINTTIASNHAVNQYGGVWASPLPAQTVAITNTILWGNGGDDLECTSGCTVAYSDLEEGLWPGMSNISEDPRFVDSANVDYHLSADSPCVDAGTNASAPSHDFEGDPRPFGDSVDMGADELWPLPAVTLSTDQAGAGPPGIDVTYVFTITNAGNYTDIISLDASGVWTPALDVDTTGPLGAGRSLAVTLTVGIPPGAADGASDVATLTATSGWSAAVTDSAQATTTARWYKVYLPVTLKNPGP